MEHYWEQCMFKYLRVEPSEHHVMLTEPPLNTPENREYTAEIMFETFNVPGPYLPNNIISSLQGSVHCGPSFHSFWCSNRCLLCISLQRRPVHCRASRACLGRVVVLTLTGFAHTDWNGY